MFYWENLNIEKCPCQGFGWVEFQNDYIKCSIHYIGQLHPSLKNDKIQKINDEMSIDVIKSEINSTIDLINNLQELLGKANQKLDELEFLLINKTPTIKTKIIEDQESIEVIIE